MANGSQAVPLLWTPWFIHKLILLKADRGIDFFQDWQKATRPSIAKWQFQNSFLLFLGVWVKLVALLGASWNASCCGGYSHNKQVRNLWKVKRVAALGFSPWKLEKPLKNRPSRTRPQPDTSQAFDRTGREPWAVWTSPYQHFTKLMIRVCGMPIRFKSILLVVAIKENTKQIREEVQLAMAKILFV